jgi:hypothetical protein
MLLSRIVINFLTHEWVMVLHIQATLVCITHVFLVSATFFKKFAISKGPSNFLVYEILRFYLNPSQSILFHIFTLYHHKICLMLPLLFLPLSLRVFQPNVRINFPFLSCMFPVPSIPSSFYSTAVCIKARK